ncbi:hypothetical protein KEM52_005684 [Ascosphaera acerosa]|nr:hypothetical protein KEM52_005684 [Ascosphaera acerosa]
MSPGNPWASDQHGQGDTELPLDLHCSFGGSDVETFSDNDEGEGADSHWDGGVAGMKENGPRSAAASTLVGDLDGDEAIAAAQRHVHATQPGRLATVGSATDYDYDYHLSGPGRRVGYSDLTSIDWIFEQNKERARLHRLAADRSDSASRPARRRLRSLLDSSQVWLVLIFSGIAIGCIAAGIDIVGAWLGDLKGGYCRRGPQGGRFYLSRTFCCWGEDDLASCSQWVQWRDAFSTMVAAGYAVEYLLYVLFSVLFASAASVLALAYAPYAKHSGLPEIKSILNGLVITEFLSPMTLLIKSLGLCLAVASGLWLGKEGPLIHVACCCADLLMWPFESLRLNEATRREVLAAAAASGISVAFGSPIGGVLFSLEQVASHFPDRTMWRSFVCAMVAAVTLHTIDPWRTGKIVLYQVTFTRGWHSFEMLPFILLGVCGGLYGALLIKLNMRVARWRLTTPAAVRWPVAVVAAVALVSAVVNFPNILMRAQLSDLVHNLFSQCSDSPDDPLLLCKTGAASWATISLLLSAAVLGFLLATITFGLDIPAGIILPSLAIGGLYGRAVGVAMEMWQRAHPDFFLFLFDKCGESEAQCVSPGLYAIVGAAAALGGTSRMTVSIVVIMFELTGALTYAIPIMVSVMLSKWCGDIFGKKSIYECWIHLRGYTFLDYKEDSSGSSSAGVSTGDVRVREVMTRMRDLTVLTATGHTIETLRAVLNATTFRGFPIVRDTAAPVLLGYISRDGLAFALDAAAGAGAAASLPSHTPVSFTARQSCDHASSGAPDSSGAEETALDLRPWVDHTPLTISVYTSFPIVLQMFQRLGVRYLLLVDQGRLRGLLTKRDVWMVLESLEYGSDDVSTGPGADAAKDADAHPDASGPGTDSRDWGMGVAGDGRRAVPD